MLWTHSTPEPPPSLPDGAKSLAAAPQEYLSCRAALCPHVLDNSRSTRYCIVDNLSLSACGAAFRASGGVRGIGRAPGRCGRHRENNEDGGGRLTVPPLSTALAPSSPQLPDAHLWPCPRHTAHCSGLPTLAPLYPEAFFLCGGYGWRRGIVRIWWGGADKGTSIVARVPVCQRYYFFFLPVRSSLCRHLMIPCLRDPASPPSYRADPSFYLRETVFDFVHPLD